MGEFKLKDGCRSWGLVGSVEGWLFTVGNGITGLGYTLFTNSFIDGLNLIMEACIMTSLFNYIVGSLEGFL